MWAVVDPSPPLSLSLDQPMTGTIPPQTAGNIILCNPPQPPQTASDICATNLVNYGTRDKIEKNGTLKKSEENFTESLLKLILFKGKTFEIFLKFKSRMSVYQSLKIQD